MQQIEKYEYSQSIIATLIQRERDVDGFLPDQVMLWLQKILGSACVVTLEEMLRGTTRCCQWLGTASVLCQ